MVIVRLSSFGCPSEVTVYAPFASFTVHDAVWLLPTLVDLFTPLPVRWKLSFADLSVTEIVYEPAGSVLTTLPFSRSVTKTPGPTVACRNLPLTTALEISFVKFGSVVITPYSFAYWASCSNCWRSISELHTGRWMPDGVPAGSSGVISSGCAWA